MGSLRLVSPLPPRVQRLELTPVWRKPGRAAGLGHRRHGPPARGRGQLRSSGHLRLRVLELLGVGVQLQEKPPLAGLELQAPLLGALERAPVPLDVQLEVGDVLLHVADHLPVAAAVLAALRDAALRVPGQGRQLPDPAVTVGDLREHAERRRLPPGRGRAFALAQGLLHHLLQLAAVERVEEAGVQPAPEDVEGRRRRLVALAGPELVAVVRRALRDHALEAEGFEGLVRGLGHLLHVGGPPPGPVVRLRGDDAVHGVADQAAHDVPRGDVVHDRRSAGAPHRGDARDADRARRVADRVLY
mmetsp:Transcript_19667/g.55294  ORF Transcript_19667/g.55294 Transcript_19667/m.55294 type:complete len:302 (+) Transcript_19667:271-1176(+)